MNESQLSIASNTLSLSKDRLRNVFANTSNFIHLCNELFIPDGKRAVVYATEYYYHVSKEARKIRKLIFSLDKIGDTALADSVMDCAEPPSDPSITPSYLIPVFQALIGDWNAINGYFIAPPARAELFKANFNACDQPAEAGKYYALYHYDPNWKALSLILYKAGETAALDIARHHIEALTDLTLTPPNIIHAFRHMPLWKSWDSYGCLEIPLRQHEEIAAKFDGQKAKLELITKWLAEFPFPTWHHVKDLLRRLESEGRGREGSADEVEKIYIKVVTPPHTPSHSSPTLDTPSYPHQVVNDQFPGICFLGKPHEVTVESDPITISPPGHGVTLKIPPNAAVRSSDKPVNVSLQTCLSSSLFEGCTPFSAIYHTSSDTPFDKDMELTFEHFADLKTNQQANMMRFFRAESKGERRYIFTPMEGGEFKVGSHSCTISIRQFSFVCAGSEPSSQIDKRYTVLCSYSNEIEGVRHAAVAISLDDAVYHTNFREALKEEWNVQTLSHRCKLNVSFIERSACVKYDASNIKGWTITPDTTDCTLSLEDVDHSNRHSLTQYDYPPRVIFDIIPDPPENAETSILQLQLTGVTKQTKPIDFQLLLRASAVITKSIEVSREYLERPKLQTLYNLPTSRGDIKIIQSSASHYRHIGTNLLDDRYGERIDEIELEKSRRGRDIIVEVYKQWLAEDTNCSWATLTDCFRQCDLNNIALSIEQHFGLSSPQQSPRGTVRSASETVITGTENKARGPAMDTGGLCDCCNIL